MLNQIRQIFRSGKFLTGFILFAAILLLIIIYPLFNPGDPLQMIGYNSFIKPGTYFSLYDSLDVPQVFTFNIEGSDEARIYAKLRPDDKEFMKDWLLKYSEQEASVNITEEDIVLEDTKGLLELWWTHYSPEIRIDGMTIADRRAYTRLDQKLDGLFNIDDWHVYTTDPETGEYDVLHKTVSNRDYVNVDDVANVFTLPLGTDNFGRDVLKQLVAAIATSLQIGLIAGVIATFIGLVLGLLAGYVGGIVDDAIMFISNLFTVIPGFVLLILISFSIGQGARSATTVAVVIGLTAWVWTTRSVRSQVLSLRNRDHVNLSKLSGHSLPKIVIKDILPYIASYVVMALILQISTAILAEAGLSMLGLGPKTTEVPTLGIMMNWAMTYQAHLMGAWWAYYPVVLIIALISFSLNLMNTGLDQVFNPQLRD